MKCKHIWRVLESKTASEGMDGGGTFSKVSVKFYCEKCTELKEASKKLYVEIKD